MVYGRSRDIELISTRAKEVHISHDLRQSELSDLREDKTIR